MTFLNNVRKVGRLVFFPELLVLSVASVTWNAGRTHQEWKQAVVINIHTNGNKRECTNYRGISLLNPI
jgi:hypothetical protein